jgi:hypothetical protein
MWWNDIADYTAAREARERNENFRIVDVPEPDPAYKGKGSRHRKTGASAGQHRERQVLAQLVVIVDLLVTERQGEYPLPHQRFHLVLGFKLKRGQVHTVSIGPLQNLCEIVVAGVFL